METTAALVNDPLSMGPTCSQAHQARTNAELILNLAGLTLSPTNPLAALIARPEREAEPGF